MGSITTIHQNLYEASLPPITVELVELASLTTKSVSDLTVTLGTKTRLGIAASFGKRRVLKTLAFSTETRVLLIVMDGNSRHAHRQKGILKDELLCNVLLEKHVFLMELIAAALYLNLGLFIRSAFDIVPGDTRGSMAAYKRLLEQARTKHSVNARAVRKTFAEKRFVQPKQHLFALRAWACHIGVRGLPNQPGVIDTSIKGTKAHFNFHSFLVVI